MNYHEQLGHILEASGWSQEQLAHQLSVSFATLNSWINKRSRPRAKAIINIDKLYLDIIGASEVDPDVVLAAKQIALGLRISSKQLAGNKNALEKLTLHLTYHTNTIEGSTMTLADVEDVLFEHKVLANRTAVEQAEARNHQATLFWLVDELVSKGSTFRIERDLILGIHLRLMNGIIGDAGEFRKHSVRIMGSHVPLANQQKVPGLIDDFVKDLATQHSDPIGLMAYSHARFEKIHPFSDGNGRTGRLIMLAQALNAGLIPPVIIKELKYAYYKYLELAQVKDIHQPLELFIAQSVQFTHGLLEVK
jgi:Fic family protein